jgi:VWFA-related protein
MTADSLGVDRLWRFALCLALVCPASSAAAQPPQPHEQVDVARLIVDARVVDDDGHAITGLDADDFDVRIGGQSVRVESAQWIGGAEPARGPLASTSLSGVVGTGPRGRLVVFVVQKSLQRDRLAGLLRILQDSGRLLETLTPHDRVAVLSFDSHLKIWLDFTDDLDRVRTVLTDEIMFSEPGPLEGGGGVSMMAGLSRDAGRSTYAMEDALARLGHALEPLPGAKSVILIGYGFGEMTVALGMVGSRANRGYDEARDALHAARVAIFSLDVTDVDYHTFEHGLETVSTETGGFFVRTRNRTRRAIAQVADALVGYYVLFTEVPEIEPGTHAIEVDLVGGQGTVFARTIYTN